MIPAVAFKKGVKWRPLGQDYEDIIQYAHLIKESHLLKSAGDAVNLIFPRHNFFSFNIREKYFSAIVRGKTGEHIYKRSFAAAIRPHQASNHFFRNINRKMVYGMHSAETFH